MTSPIDLDMDLDLPPLSIEEDYGFQRTLQKLVLSKEEFYKKPGYAAQEDYMKTVQTASTKRQEAEVDIFLADEVLYASEKENKDCAIALSKRWYDGVCLSHDKTATYLEQQIELASDIDKFIAAQADLLDHQDTSESFKAQVLEKCQSCIQLAVDMETWGKERIKKESDREYASIYTQWCNKLTIAREKLLEAHKTDTDSANLWEEHPPNPLDNPCVLKGIYYDSPCVFDGI